MISEPHKQAPALSAPGGTAQPPSRASSPVQLASWAPQGSAGPGLRIRREPERPAQPPRNTPGSGRRRPRSRPAQPDSASATRGAHQPDRSLPLRRGPATPGVASQPSSEKLQRQLPRLLRLADAISRVAHNSERSPDTSAALPGTAATAPAAANPGG